VVEVEEAHACDRRRAPQVDELRMRLRRRSLRYALRAQAICSLRFAAALPAKRERLPASIVSSAHSHWSPQQAARPR